jgi:hypothetical protein
LQLHPVPVASDGRMPYLLVERRVVIDTIACEKGAQQRPVACFLRALVGVHEALKERDHGAVALILSAAPA